MSIFEYFASLRAEILEVVTGIENSGWSLFWDETTPNYVTKGKSEKLYKKQLNEAKKFGLYVVTRHRVAICSPTPAGVNRKNQIARMK